MTIEEALRAAETRTGDNGLTWGVLAGEASEASEQPQLERMAGAVPRSVVERLGRTLVVFVPFLCKQRRGVAVATSAAEAGENRKELCHHLDVKPGGNLLLISLRFYENDNYGLAMEFFDKLAYLATLEPDPRGEFDQLLRRQWGAPSGELTPETGESRQAVKAPPADGAGDEAWVQYVLAAEADALGLYMAAVFTDVFFEDLFDPETAPPPAQEVVYERVRLMERLYPANRGYGLQVVRQKPRKRR